MYFPNSRKDSELAELRSVSVSEENDSFVLKEKSVKDLISLMENNVYSSEQIMNLYLNRIDRLNPLLHAVLDISTDAIEEARECDKKRKAGEKLPLLGVPVLIKDNIEVRGLVNSAGSLALEDYIATEDAPLVKKLKDAGAVIFGKTNMSEWAFYRSSSGISGWSGRGMRVRNPYSLDRSTYGSSSGSACAVSANLCALAVGTETDGSIVGPSALCGIVGIKPTHSLINGEGIIPLASSFDTPGPMARSVEDAAIMLSVMSSGSRYSDDYSKNLNIHAIHNTRIGLINNELTQKSFIINELKKNLSILNDSGATVIDVHLENIDAWRECELKAFSYEFRKDLNLYLKKRKHRIQSLKDVIQFNLDHSNEELVFFDQDLLENAQACTISDEEGKELIEKAKLLTGKNGIDRLLDDNELDCLIAVETIPAWKADYINGDPLHEVSGSIAAVSGYPSICVPMGNIGGLPLGMLFISRKYSEKQLIDLAYSYEQLSRQRIVPNFYQNIEFDRE